MLKNSNIITVERHAYDQLCHLFPCTVPSNMGKTPPTLDKEGRMDWGLPHPAMAAAAPHQTRHLLKSLEAPAQVLNRRCPRLHLYILVITTVCLCHGQYCVVFGETPGDLPPL